MSPCEIDPATAGECEAEDSRCAASRTLHRLVGFVASALDVRFAFVAAFAPPPEPRRVSLWLARDYGLRSEFTQLETPEGDLSTGVSLGHILQRALPHEPGLAETRPSACLSLPLFDTRGRVAGSLGILDVEGTCRFAARDRLVPLARRAAAEVERWAGAASR
jgi:hypothetical protein